MKGSVSRCNDEYGLIGDRHDMHINGNAIVRIGDPAFDDFLSRVKNFYPAFMVAGKEVAGCRTGRAF